MGKKFTSIHIISICVVALLLSLLIACSKSDSSFTQMPGFQQYFAKNQPSMTLPNEQDQALLASFKPRVFLAKGQTSFIDFYADYIANGALYINNKLISKQVTQELLNQHVAL